MVILGSQIYLQNHAMYALLKVIVPVCNTQPGPSFLSMVEILALNFFNYPTSQEAEKINHWKEKSPLINIICVAKNLDSPHAQLCLPASATPPNGMSF